MVSTDLPSLIRDSVQRSCCLILIVNYCFIRGEFVFGEPVGEVVRLPYVLGEIEVRYQLGTRELSASVSTTRYHNCNMAQTKRPALSRRTRLGKPFTETPEQDIRQHSSSRKSKSKSRKTTKKRTAKKALRRVSEAEINDVNDDDDESSAFSRATLGEFEGQTVSEHETPAKHLPRIPK